MVCVCVCVYIIYLAMGYSEEHLKSHGLRVQVTFLANKDRAFQKYEQHYS